jgi:UDP-glucose 4-epimerase
VPLFIKQIKSGKNITITDPKMTRFIMSLKSAIKLVLFAFENADPGDIFVQKSPACTIADLATALKELMKSKNKIQIIGTRHGEKLYETLLNKEEMLRARDLGDYYRIPADTRDLNYSIYMESGEKNMSRYEEYNSNNTTMLTVPAIKKVLLKEEFVLKEIKGEKD